MPYKDPEKKKSAAKARYLANREKKIAQAKAWVESHREQVRENHRRWQKENMDRVKRSQKKYESKDPKKWKDWRNKWRRDWYKNNPEKAAELCRGRVYRKTKSLVSLTAKEKQAVLSLERTRKQLQKETGRIYHIDHILPIAHGGIHHPINLRILDGTDNSSKRDKLLPEAIALAPEHFRLYSERVSPERAWEFVRQLAAGLGLSEDDLDALISGKPLKSKPTLEDFMA
jgi:hypothetical protein